MTVVVSQAAGAVTHVSASATEYWYSTEAMPDGLAPGSVSTEVSATVRRRLAPGSFIVAVGGVVSSSQAQFDGVASVFPAASIARTSNVRGPSASGAVVCGVVQAAQAPPSTLHSNVEPASLEEKVKSGVESRDGSPGLVTRVVSGVVRSTVTSITALALRPARSRAVAFRW